MIASAFLQKRIPTKQPTTVPFQTRKVWVWAKLVPGSHLKVLQSCLRGVLELKDCTLMIIDVRIVFHWALFFGYVHLCFELLECTKKTHRSLIWHLCTADVSSISLLPVEADSSDAEDLRSLHRWGFEGCQWCQPCRINPDMADKSMEMWICLPFLMFDSSDINALWISDVSSNRVRGVASERDTSVGSDPGTFLYFPTVSKLVK